MKTLSLFALMIFCSAFAFSQSKKIAVCCSQSTSSTQLFAMLASDKKFIQAHPNPKKYHYQSTIGKAITYKTVGGADAKGFELGG